MDKGTEELGFSSQWGRFFFLFSAAFRSAVGPTQPTMQWGIGGFCPVSRLIYGTVPQTISYIVSLNPSASNCLIRQDELCPVSVMTDLHESL
jgi:hypothetical protein